MINWALERLGFATRRQHLNSVSGKILADLLKEFIDSSRPSGTSLVSSLQ